MTFATFVVFDVATAARLATCANVCDLAICFQCLRCDFLDFATFAMFALALRPGKYPSQIARFGRSAFVTPRQQTKQTTHYPPDGQLAN